MIRPHLIMTRNALFRFTFAKIIVLLDLTIIHSVWEKSNPLYVLQRPVRARVWERISHFISQNVVIAAVWRTALTYILIGSVPHCTYH